MMQRYSLIACATLMLTAGLAVAQPRAGEWVSYRDAYRAMVQFYKYGGPKHLLQQHLQLVPREKGVLGEGVQLTLQGRSVQSSLALDATGRGVLPLVKSAYDENAVLAPNRPLGGFTVRPRVSLALRADGAYDAAGLRAACEQALGFARYAYASARTLQCAGVRLVFAKQGVDASVRVRAGGGEQVLALARGAAFAGDLDDDFPVAVYRFGGRADAQLVTYNAPLAIVPLFE